MNLLLHQYHQIFILDGILTLIDPKHRKNIQIIKL
jgi:hypothetical protein